MLSVVNDLPVAGSRTMSEGVHEKLDASLNHYVSFDVLGAFISVATNVTNQTLDARFESNRA